MMKSVLNSVVAAAVICVFATGFASANLLINGGFEDGLNGWTFTGDGVTDTASLSTDTPSGIGMSADIDINGPNGFPWLQQDIDISSLSAGTTLFLTASVKEVEAATPDDGMMTAQLWYLPLSKGFILDNAFVSFSSPDWTVGSASKAIPAGAVFARVLFTPQTPGFGVGNGQYRIDDVSLFVPEPSTCILAMLSVGGLLYRRQR